MAEVFRAVVPGAEGFRRDLVVKRILGERARAANFIEMFVHEARISALLHHPNVVQVFDFGQVDGSYFLAMELLRGRDLLAVLRALSERQRSFPISIATHVAHQVALGLGYAHALTSPEGQPLNIIHRDVSPSNIMLLRTGGVKLLDFGIAQAIGEMDSQESERRSFKGKLSYMSPERVRDEPQDGRVDLFALGAVLWEMLVGRRLFHGKTDVEKLRSVLDRPIPLPSSLRPDVPAALDGIVMKALARHPDDRYRTGEALADDLEHVIADSKYHSRMLPALLSELFGSAPSSAHLTLSAAAPELFAFEPMNTPTTTPALSSEALKVASVAALKSLAADRSGALAKAGAAVAAVSRRIWPWRPAIAVAIVVGLLAVGAVIAFSRPPRPIGAGPISPAPAVLIKPLSAPVVEQSLPPSVGEVGESGNGGATTAASAPDDGAATVVGEPSSDATPGRRQVRRRAAPVKTPARMGAGRITRGLSIDPFAEAATRGPPR